MRRGKFSRSRIWPYETVALLRKRVAGAHLSQDKLRLTTERARGAAAVLHELGPAGNGGNGSWPGNDYYVLEDFPGPARLPNGNFVVQNAAGTAVGEAVVSVSGKVLTMNISLSTLGGDDGIAEVRGRFGNVLVVNGFPLNAITDCAPNPLGSVVTRK